MSNNENKNPEPTDEVMMRPPFIHHLNKSRLDEIGKQYVDWVKINSPSRWDDEGNLVQPPWYQILSACGGLGLLFESVAAGKQINSKEYFTRVGFIVLNSYLWWADRFANTVTLSDFLDDTNDELMIKWHDIGNGDTDYPAIFELVHAVAEMDIYELRHAIAYLWLPIMMEDQVDVVECCESALNILPVMVKDAISFFGLSKDIEVN